MYSFLGDRENINERTLAESLYPFDRERSINEFESSIRPFRGRSSIDEEASNEPARKISPQRRFSPLREKSSVYFFYWID